MNIDLNFIDEHTDNSFSNPAFAVFIPSSERLRALSFLGLVVLEILASVSAIFVSKSAILFDSVSIRAQLC